MDSHMTETDMEREDLDRNDDNNDPSTPTPTKSPLTPALLSKSWAIRKAHAPMYTGGKVTYCRHDIKESDETDVTESNSPPSTSSDAPGIQRTSLFILPVGGDVSIVDMTRGVPLATLRKSSITRGLDNDNQADDDDEGEELFDDNDNAELDRDAITAYALSHGHGTILTCSRNSLLRLYSLKSYGNRLRTKVSVTLQKSWGKSGHTLPVTEMEFHCSDVFVATGSIDGTVRVWDVRGSYVTHLFRPVEYRGQGGSARLSVTAVRWKKTHAELVLAIARDDGSIVIHDLKQKKSAERPMAILRDHMSPVTCMDWSYDLSPVFITAGRDGVVNLWEIRTISQESTKRGSKKKKGAHKSDVGTVIEYSRVHTLPIYEQVEGMVLLSPNKARKNLVVATAGSKGQVRLWKVDNNRNDDGMVQRRLQLFHEQPSSEAFGQSRGGYMDLVYVHDQGTHEQLVVADAEHNITFLDLSSEDETLLSRTRTMIGHNDDILDLKLIPESKDEGLGQSRKVVVATNSSKVGIFDLEDFSCELLEGHSGTVLCVDVSPCGRYIATCGKDKQMRVWNVAQGKCVALAVGHTEAVGAVAVSRKPGKYEVGGKASTSAAGAFVITASLDRTIKRWNLPGSAVLDDQELSEELPLKAYLSARAHEKDINVVVVAPNDSLIATGSQDKTTKIWRSSDLSLQATLKGHRRGVWDCAFSSYDKVIATSSGDRTIKLWTLSDYTCVRTFQGHSASVLRVRFLTGGLQLASAGADGLLKVWTIRNNECVATMDGHEDKVWALDVSHDSDLISAGADSRILVWKDVTKQEAEAKHAEEEQGILLDQKLANHLRFREFGEALEIALKRDKPQVLQKVISALIEADLDKGLSGIESLQKIVQSWSPEKVVQILRYCREWNTRARNCHLATIVCNAVVTVFHASTLESMDGVPEILAGIHPYAERHFDRLDRLCTSSFLIDFVLSEMGDLGSDDEDEAYAKWESSSRLVLPSRTTDGRFQVGGRVVVGGSSLPNNGSLDAESESVMTVGESDSGSSDEE